MNGEYNPMDKMELKNDHLSLSLLTPGTVYTGSRFDWTGIVDQVSLKKIPFLGIESDGKFHGSGGIGLSCEFGMRHPIGYRGTKIGKEFMKIGVGALTRENIRAFNFFKPYKVRPFLTEVKPYKDHVEYLQENCRVRGYAYNYRKTISLEKNKLIISYDLKNIGEEPLKTEEYCHNFLKPGGGYITQQITLETSHPFRRKKLSGPLEIEPQRVSFKENPQREYYVNALMKHRPRDFSWTIKDGASGVTLKCKENFPVSQIAFWGKKHVMAPEAFHSFNLLPGDDLQWSREYSFEI
jgi:hypothetical protein